MKEVSSTEFRIGEHVEKYTGDAQYEGFVVARYHTLRGHLRYVVEVYPQGFQMIVSSAQLRIKKHVGQD